MNQIESIINTVLNFIELLIIYFINYKLNKLNRKTKANGVINRPNSI